MSTSEHSERRNLSMFSAEDFHVSRTPLLVDVADLRTSATCGPRLLESFASLNPDGSWRKTCQGYSQVTLDGSLERFSGTWPRAGMTRNGIAYLRPPSVLLTDAIEPGSWPTPAASLHNLSEDLDNWQARRVRVKAEKVNGNGFGMPLTVAVRLWPTPTSRDHKDGSAQSCANVPANGLLGRVVHQWPTPTSNDRLWAGYQKGKRGARFFSLSGAARASTGQPYDRAASGSLNPTWVEWLIGIPARVDRLRGLGNAIVPQIAEWIARRILDAEGLA